MNIDELRADLLKPQLKPSVGPAKPNLVSTVVVAIETRDSAVLSTLLNTIAKDKLVKTLSDSKILAALVDNYTPNTHTQLIKKGFDLEEFSEKVLFTHIDFDGWRNLLVNTPKTKAFDKWLQDTFQETLDYNFQKRYPMCKKSAAEFRTVLHQYDPVVHDKGIKVFFDNSEGVEGLLPLDQAEFNRQSQEDWAWLKTISKDSWAYGFQHGFYIDKTKLQLFLNFFGNLPLAKQAMNDIHTQAQNSKNSFMGLLNGDGNGIETTVLWNKLTSAGKTLFSKELQRAAKPLQQLGLHEREIVLYAALSPKFVTTFTQSLPAQDRECLTYLISDSSGLTDTLSFIHFLLVGADAEILLHLSKSPRVCEKIQEAFSDPTTLRYFSRSTSIDDYIKIFKKIPQLAEWRDHHNNTLLHYALALKDNRHYGADPGRTATRIIEIVNSNPQLRDSNNSGVSLRDMCAAADPKLLADYDKKALGRAIKEAGLTVNKAKSVKRKI